MTDVADLPAALPALEINAPGEARASLQAAGEAVLSALTIRAMRAHADALAGDRDAHTVSVSLDMTGRAFTGGEIAIRSEVDRQTRTIIFMGAMLSSGDEVILKATSIFRLSETG